MRVEKPLSFVLLPSLYLEYEAQHDGAVLIKNLKTNNAQGKSITIFGSLLDVG